MSTHSDSPDAAPEAAPNPASTTTSDLAQAAVAAYERKLEREQAEREASLAAKRFLAQKRQETFDRIAAEELARMAQEILGWTITPETGHWPVSEEVELVARCRATVSAWDKQINEFIFRPPDQITRDPDMWVLCATGDFMPDLQNITTLEDLGRYIVEARDSRLQYEEYMRQEEEYMRQQESSEDDDWGDVLDETVRGYKATRRYAFLTEAELNSETRPFRITGCVFNQENNEMYALVKFLDTGDAGDDGSDDGSPFQRTMQALDTAAQAVLDQDPGARAGWISYLFEVLDEQTGDEELLSEVISALNARLEQGSW